MQEGRRDWGWQSGSQDKARADVSNSKMGSLGRSNQESYIVATVEILPGDFS